MTTFPYIVLSDSAAECVKRFKVIKMSTPIVRTDSFDITLGGRVDKTSGVLIDYFYYTVKLKTEEDDPNYGVLSDIQLLFRLNNPNSTPNDLITLTDHFGVNHNVKFQNDMAPEPITTQLEGPNSYHYVNITLIKIPEVRGSGS